MPASWKPSPAAIARARALAEHSLPPAEFMAQVGIPLSPEEQAEVLDLVRWFRTRYPTPGDRLAYVRRAYRRWTELRRRVGSVE